MGSARSRIAITVAATLLVASGARAAGASASVVGPNTDFPDADATLPFDAVAPHGTFLTLSNVGTGAIDAQWYFYDESGELLASVTRAILGEGGTDVVDLESVADRTLDGEGGFVLGPSESLAGRRGFAVVIGDGAARLMASYTIANTSTLAAFGGAGAGSGSIGGLAPGAGLLGTTFKPTTLEDNELIVIALNPGPQSTVNSLTDGSPPPEGAPLLELAISLRGNSGSGVIAEGTLTLRGSALFTTLDGLFPGTTLDQSATIVVFGSEGDGYSGSELDPDGDDDVAIIGFYGQTLGSFGTGQHLRTLL